MLQIGNSGDGCDLASTLLPTSGCSAASNCQPGHHAVSTIVCSCRVQAVVGSRSAMVIDNIPQIEVQFTFKAKNRTRGNTSYVFKHSIEEVNCSASETVKGNCH